MSKKVVNITHRTLQLINITLESRVPVILKQKDLTLAVENKLKNYQNLGFVKVFDVEDEKPITQEIKVEEPQQEMVVEQVIEEPVVIEPEVVEEKEETTEEVKEQPKQNNTKRKTTKNTNKNTKKQEEEK